MPSELTEGSLPVSLHSQKPSGVLSLGPGASLALDLIKSLSKRELSAQEAGSTGDTAVDK